MYLYSGDWAHCACPHSLPKFQHRWDELRKFGHVCPDFRHIEVGTERPRVMAIVNKVMWIQRRVDIVTNTWLLDLISVATTSSAIAILTKNARENIEAVEYTTTPTIEHYINYTIPGANYYQICIISHEVSSVWKSYCCYSLLLYSSGVLFVAISQNIPNSEFADV